MFDDRNPGGVDQRVDDHCDLKSFQKIGGWARTEERLNIKSYLYTEKNQVM